jgi:hypothetical protein
MATCDHCFCCDVLGICCATIPAEVRARLEAAVAPPPDPLYAAVLADAKTIVTLAELVRREARQPKALLPPARLSLPSGQVAEPDPTDSRKEAINVPARAIR